MTGEAVFIAIIGWLVAIGIAVLGWFIDRNRQRTLLQKQIAIQLLNENRFEEAWVKGLREVHKAVASHSTDELRQIAERYFDNEETDEERDLCYHIRIVLNNFELVAIAVLNGAADEMVVKWSFDYYFKKFGTALEGFISTARAKRHDEDLLVNFTELAKKWKRDPELARPS